MGSGATPEPDGTTERQPGAVGGEGGTGGGTGGAEGSGGMASGADQSATPDSGAWNREELNPVLRDLTPTQLNDLFVQMSNTMNSMAAGAHEGKGAGSADVIEEPPKPEPPSKDELREMFDPSSEKFDPNTAFGKLAEQQYGPLLQGINLRATQGMLGRFKEHYPDFSKYEAEIMEELKKLPANQVTEQAVASMYLQRRGLDAVKADEDARRKATVTGTTKPSPPEGGPSGEEGGGTTRKLADWQVEVAKKQFPNDPNPEQKYAEWLEKAEAGPVEFQVPLGGGKFG